MNPAAKLGEPLFFEAVNPDAIGLVPPRSSVGTAIRTAVRSLSHMQKEALIRSTGTGAIWRVASDEGAYLMGDDAAPCPLAHLTTGMVASFMEEILALARERNIPIAHILLVQDNYYTMEGSALQGTMRGGALPVELRAELDSRASEEELSLLVNDAVGRSPIHGLIRTPLPSRFTLTHNGNQIEPGDVEQIDSPAEKLPRFEVAKPGAGDWDRLVHRNGMSPRTEEATSSSGSSFADKQSRRLHVRGICTLLPDGTKQIEQHLLNPHGSVFYFLSEEGPAEGGPGRAPDAMTYVSAGIAFCFMTQFGRYAKITGKTLREYSIVQDTLFSRGSPKASGATERVETHVNLDSDHDDNFARQALKMSQQTCFLHALCRSTPGVKVSVVLAGR